MAKKRNDEKNADEASLGSFDIRVNEFGEIITNVDLESLNDFLNKKVEDKKFKDRPDYQAASEEE
ncbi:MAG: hypothetical protein SH848_20415 [Saprospiraceae bacterium]|nr:hypothetical protein [Saprospiraceae bacterium]MDZ4706305.1 hypothetical protein [Saprospiraceae bacterium]